MRVKIQDLAAAAELADMVGRVEVIGPDDALLGTFTPALRPGRMFPEFGVSNEEMDRRLNDPKSVWVSGDEVMARLRQLRKNADV